MVSPIPVLHCRSVGVRPGGGRELLSDIDLVLNGGDLVAVAGRRGAGKSLLARTCAADLLPDRGRLHLFGEDVRAPGGGRPSLRRRIGWCADRPVLVPSLSGAENVALALRVRGAPAREAQSDATELLTWLGGGADSIAIGIARALVARPELVILDEPLRDDGVSAMRLNRLVAEMRRTGSAILVTTDDLRRCELLEPSERYVLAAGRLLRC